MCCSKTFPVDIQIVASVETLNRGLRLDPSRYNETGERMTRHLKRLAVSMPKTHELPEFVEVFLPNRFSRVYLDDGDYGLPMLGTSTMLMARLPTDSRIKIAGNLEHCPLRIRAGDILVSRSGTVGTAVLCGQSYCGFVASDDCFRLRLGESIRGFVAAYLRSPFGERLLIPHGKVVQHLKPADIKDLRIPLIDAKERQQINSLMLQSCQLVDWARGLFAEAEKKIAAALGISGKVAQPQHWLNWNTAFLNLSADLFGSRLDPHFYDPDVRQLWNSLTRLPHRKLSSIGKVGGLPASRDSLPIVDMAHRSILQPT